MQLGSTPQAMHTPDPGRLSPPLLPTARLRAGGHCSSPGRGSAGAGLTQARAHNLQLSLLPQACRLSKGLVEVAGEACLGEHQADFDVGIFLQPLGHRRLYTHHPNRKAVKQEGPLSQRSSLVHFRRLCAPRALFGPAVTHRVVGSISGAPWSAERPSCIPVPLPHPEDWHPAPLCYCWQLFAHKYSPRATGINHRRTWKHRLFFRGIFCLEKRQPCCYQRSQLWANPFPRACSLPG